MEYIYGALLLHRLGQSVTEQSLKKVIEATGAEVDESKIKTLIAALQGVDIEKELENASVAVAASPGASSVGKEGAEAKKEEKKEEDKPSESAAGLASLFG